MKKIANKDSKKYVEGKIEFQGSNLEGVYINDHYVVLSYGWYPLYVWGPTPKGWWGNFERYRPSTSKQSSQCRPQCAIKYVTHEDLMNSIPGLDSFIRQRKIKELEPYHEKNT